MVEDIHPFHQVLISLCLGLFVGLQRQWAASPLGGIRTFALVSLYGTTCAILAEKFGPWVYLIGLLSLTAAVVTTRLQKPHTGMVPEISVFITFAIGAMVRIGPIWLAAAEAAILAILLQLKFELHGIASRFTEKEIRAIMQFVLIALVIFPLVPNQAYGPYLVLNPHDLWLMMLLIVAINLVGYIIYKFFGQNAGILLSGVLGGMISSTATTMSYAKRSKTEASSETGPAVIILIAWTLVYLRLIFEVLTVAPSFQAVLAPLFIMFCVSAISSVWIWRKTPQGSSGMPPQNNPAELRTAFTFALLYAVILLAVAAAQERFGKLGLGVVAMVSGMTDMDAVTLSTARMVETGTMTATDAWPVIIIAALSNLIFKGAIAGIVGGKRLLRTIALPLISSLVTGVGLILFWAG